MVAALLDELESLGIHLWPEGAHLRFRAPRGALSAALRGQLAQHKAEVVQALRDRGQKSRVAHPLSYNQASLWFVHETAPDSAAYNIGLAARVRSTLDPAALREAFQALVDRHPTLRTTYALHEGEPVQEVHGHMPADFVEVDATAWSEDALREALDDDQQRPFDLARESLFRVRLYRRGPGQDVLLMTAHHIAADGWSGWMLLDELKALYRAQLAGSASALPVPSTTYSDYVTWQRERLAADGEQLWAYWRDRCAGDMPPLDLPTDRPRPSIQGDRGASHTFALGAELSERLRALARGERTTLYTLLLAAFQVLLHRYTGQDDIAVGSPTFGRPTAFDSVIGHFVNMVVMRGDLSGQPPFRTFLHRLREVVLGGLAHQDFPFALLVERLGGARDPSRSPLFQVAFQLQQPQRSADVSTLLRSPGAGAADAADGAASPDLALEVLPLRQQEGQFDLTLDVTDLGGPLQVAIKYRAELFDAATVVRMQGHLETLLGAIVADPASPVADLPLLPAAELEQIVVEWNRTAKPYPLERCLHELIAEQAERTPDRVAVEFEGAQLSYAALDARANQLARALVARGAGPDVLVGVCMERSLEMVVALLGVLKAGSAYVPLDPTYPQERLAFMTEDAAAPIVLTQPHLAASVPAGSGQLIVLDASWTAIDAESPAPLVTAATSDHLAYMIYTSGSTGRPKGAMNTHRAIVNRLLWMQDAYPLGPDDRVLQKTPFSFDVSVWEFFWPLLTGARLVVARPEGHKDSAYLVEVITREAITTLHFVPSMLQVFLEDPGVARCASLRWVMASGEALPPDVVERFFAAGLGAELHNLYGPTEAAVDVTAWACRPGERRRSIPIGRPIANIAIHILDGRGRPVPIGVAGELHIGGVGLARGYHRRPELTAEKFVRDPFSGDPGGRLYRTGDLARHLPDGAIEYLGRLDHQVKLRGFRIELGEIETVLTEHPAVRQALVMLREAGRGDQRLVAYVAADATPQLADELRAHLRRRVPDYMVPAAVVVLSEFPLSPNGKIDRSVLPSPLAEGRAARGPAEAPRTPTEQALVALWAEVLGLAQVGIHDGFFELGGHSLLAARLVARVRTALGVELPLRSLFQAPTVAGQAELVDAARGTAPTGPALTRVPRRGPPRASFGQERLWLLEQLVPGHATYNIPLVLRLDGALDLGALERGLAAVVERHETLRTTFATVDGMLVQEVAPPGGAALSVVDLPDGSDIDARRREAHRWAAGELLKPFDLAHGPLFRAAVLPVGPEEHWLVLTLHHAIADAWSLTVALDELAARYTEQVTGRPPALAELPVQYADYAVWQRDWLQGPQLEAELAYWRERLGSAAPMLELPTDRPRPALHTTRGRVEAARLEPALVQRLKTLEREAGTTLFMTLLTGFTVLLGRYARQEDVSVGFPIAGRTRLEVEPLIGFFVNTLVLRTDLSGAPSLRQVLRRVRDGALEAFTHQDVPFEKLVEELKPTRDLSRSPLFQVMFNLLERPRPLALAGVRVEPATLEVLAGMEHVETKFDLTLNAWEDDEGVGLALEYNVGLFDRETAHAMLGHLRVLLEAMAADLDQPVAALPLLTPAERERILVEWNRTDVPYPLDQCLHTLVEAQVQRAPERVALDFEGAQLTYGELDARANQLARLLVARGAGPDVLVGVCMDRSLEMVVALLGILKAGAAYVPLDPSYPVDRLAFMTADAEVAILLTQPHLVATLPAGPSHVVALDASWAAIAAEDPAPVHRDVSSEHLAYMIYTSGSTGRPKGALNTHRAIVNRLLWMQDAYGLRPDDRVLQKTPFSFDVSVWEFFWPLLAGARLVVARPEGHRDSAYLVDVITSQAITTVHFVPSMLQVFLEDPRAGSCTSLRRVVASGESLPAEVVDRFFALDLDAELHNLYGPTEAAVDVTAWACSRTERRRTIPIGRPIANLKIHILDGLGQPVPVGVAGELHIGGIGLARGYHRRPELTAEKFIPDPFSRAAGARLYRTGDLARYLPDGAIEYLGRLDHQVKLRGYRIELGEIEAALSEHPGVHQAVVLVQVVAGDARLVAYVVAPSAEAGLAAELRALLRARLPEYMVPASIVPLDELPLSPNGKVDRAALFAAAPAGLERAARVVTPRTETETALVGLWREVLGEVTLGVLDNFFDLGGHSLLAVRLIGRLRDELGVELPVRSLFLAPTVAELAEIVDAHLVAAPISPGEGPREEIEL